MKLRRAERSRRRGGERNRASAHPDVAIVGLAGVSIETIYPHVFANAEREVGGVLVGRAPNDQGLPLITGAIAALSADEQRATLTFTQDAWAHVHSTLDSSFPPDEQIVGWYHSHPSFGIFLSGHDLFIHQNFFSGPSQIAVVVDPIACTEGVFAWRDGELACLYEQSTPGDWKAPDRILAQIESSPSRTIDNPPGGSGKPTQLLDLPRQRLLVVAGVAVGLVVLALLLASLFGGSQGKSPDATGALGRSRSTTVPVKTRRNRPSHRPAQTSKIQVGEKAASLYPEQREPPPSEPASAGTQPERAPDSSVPSPGKSTVAPGASSSTGGARAEPGDE
jgi:proteasome lid subunit RPN8/RPN11